MKRSRLRRIDSKPIVMPQISAIHLYNTPTGETCVAVEIGGSWVEVIRTKATVISHIVEPAGVLEAVQKAKG